MPNDSRFINTVEEFDAVLANGAWAWPGGYPIYFLCYDGEALSFEAAEENAELVRSAIKDKDRHSGWFVVAHEINWEDTEMYCSHTNELIECAYPGDDVTPEYAEMIAKKYPEEKA